MTFEIAVATMHKTREECLNMLQKENIICDCLIVNQCDEDYFEEFTNEHQHIRIFYTKERGLSKSRNIALKNMKADVMAIADDDLYYYDDFDKKIIAYYENNQNADLVIFNMDSYKKSYPKSDYKLNFLELLRYCSVQITFSKKFVHNSDVRFNEYFGSGSNYFSSGEENIFLADCFRRTRNIYYCSKKILKLEKSESTWFKGFNEDFLQDRGAIYYRISHFYYLLLVSRFAVFKKKQIKDFSFFEILKLMRKGRMKYLAISKGKRNENNNKCR